MAITNEQIKHLAKLSRLKVSDEEAKTLEKQVDDILSFISKLAEVDTTGVKPAYYQIAKEKIAREDIIEVAEEKDEIIKGMPDAHDGLLKTPKIFK